MAEVPDFPCKFRFFRFIGGNPGAGRRVFCRRPSPALNAGVNRPSHTRLACKLIPPAGTSGNVLTQGA